MRFRFTIRDLLWLTLVVAMAVGLWLDLPMAVLSIVVAAPICAEMIFRKEAVAFAVAAPLGVLVLWLRMIEIESDRDIVFAVACLAWGIFLTLLYAAFFAVCHRIRRATKS